MTASYITTGEESAQRRPLVGLIGGATDPRGGEWITEESSRRWIVPVGGTRRRSDAFGRSARRRPERAVL